MSSLSCCAMIKHPIWNFNVYPSTCFSSAPFDVIKSAIDGLNGKFSKDEEITFT
jgi:hypothetical protein